MGATVQSTMPIVKFYSYLSKASCYQIFSANSVYQSGTNLLSYGFSRSVNNLEGQFQLTIKEDINSTSLLEDTFFDKVQNLDVVEIYENEKLQFIGVVTNKSFAAVANGLQRTISITGRSIEYLFDYLNISFNVTAMAYTRENLNKDIANLNNSWNLNNGKNPVTVKKMVTTAFEKFSEVAKAQSKISNTQILNMIADWYGMDIFDVQGGISFQYPISSNMFTDDVCTFMQYIRNLLPSNVYEIFGTIKNNKPKIVIREVPFDGEELLKTFRLGQKNYVQRNGFYYIGGSWSNLKKTVIQPELLTDYTITKSIDEVYTAFYSYIEGSAFSQEFYENMSAIKQDDKDTSSYAAFDKDKISKYGYKPLRVNFCGFSIKAAEDSNLQNDLSKKLKELNKRIQQWYGYLDEMYDATINCVIAYPYSIASIGEKVYFLGGEFYVSGVEHNWNYGNSARVTYHCERGGSYDLLGNFKPLKCISKRLGEFS